MGGHALDKFLNLSNKVSEGKNENAMSPDRKQIAFTVNPKSENFAWRVPGDPMENFGVRHAPRKFALESVL